MRLEPVQLPMTELLAIQSSKTLQELAKMYNCSYATIAKRLKEAGLPPRQRGKKLRIVAGARCIQCGRVPVMVVNSAGTIGRCSLGHRFKI